LGIYNGGLASLSGPQLGAAASEACFQRSNVPKEVVDEVIMGNVLSGGLGQNPARQVSHLCDLPPSACATTINKVCSSGLKAVAYAAQSIELAHSNVVLAGGFESMSNAPYYSMDARFGKRMGDSALIDGMIRDGLEDAYTGKHMGMFADACARENMITRSAQDDYAVESYERVQVAYQRSVFDFELVPVTVKTKKGTTEIIKDEGCWKLNEEKLRKLKPAFEPGGSVTAGNASQLADGGAGLIIVSEDMVRDLALKPLAKILSYADAEQVPSQFPSTPSIAIPKALEFAGIAMSDLTEEDFFEVNEAFAVVALVNRKKLGVGEFNWNMYGGAIALGHPLGCSGARVLVTLLTVLKENAGRYGIAALCNGGGGSTAMVVENMV
jgi:acetyl-CoA C-acetyltransferase